MRTRRPSCRCWRDRGSSRQRRALRRTRAVGSPLGDECRETAVGGRPARFSASWKAWVTFTESSGRRSGVVNTKPSSCHVGPGAAKRSTTCRRRCSRSAMTDSDPSLSVRRARSVFGSASKRVPRVSVCSTDSIPAHPGRRLPNGAQGARPGASRSSPRVCRAARAFRSRRCRGRLTPVQQ